MESRWEGYDQMVACRRKPRVLYIKIDGSVPTHSRQAQVDKFQLNSDIRVAILGITAAGTGLTLTVGCLSEASPHLLSVHRGKTTCGHHPTQHLQELSCSERMAVLEAGPHLEALSTSSPSESAHAWLTC